MSSSSTCFVTRSAQVPAAIIDREQGMIWIPSTARLDEAEKVLKKNGFTIFRPRIDKGREIYVKD